MQENRNQAPNLDRDPHEALIEKFSFMRPSDVVKHVQSVYRAALDAEPTDADSPGVILAPELESARRAIDDLPSRSPQQAQEIYELFATSDDQLDRQYICPHMPELAKLDDTHKTALNLWNDLVQDSDPDVRDTAIEPVWHDFHYHSEHASGVERELQLDGLTFEEGVELLNSYMSALRGNEL